MYNFVFLFFHTASTIYLFLVSFWYLKSRFSRLHVQHVFYLLIILMILMTIRLIASLILLDYDHMFITCVLGSQDPMMRQDLRRVGGGGILIYNTLSGICKTNAQCPLSNDITAVTGRQTDLVQSVILGPYISFMRLCTVRF